MNKHELRAAYEEHLRRRFPPHADSDDIEDWLMELLAADGYYAGIADSLLVNGSPVARGSDAAADLRVLQAQLVRLSPKSSHDYDVLHEGAAYLDGLLRLEAAMTPQARPALFDLEFTVIEPQLDNDLATVSLIDLRYRCLRGFVRCQVGEANFRLDDIPTVDFALAWGLCLRQLRPGETQFLDFTDSEEGLHLSLDGPLLTVRNGFSDETGSAQLAVVEARSKDRLGLFFRALVRDHPALLANAAFVAAVTDEGFGLTGAT